MCSMTDPDMKICNTSTRLHRPKGKIASEIATKIALADRKLQRLTHESAGQSVSKKASIANAVSTMTFRIFMTIVTDLLCNKMLK